MRSEVVDRLPQIVLRIWVSVAAKDVSEVSNESWYIGSAIIEHEGRDAIGLQPFGYAMTLGLDIMPEIAASRTDDDRDSIRIVGNIGRQQYLLVARSSLPDIH